MIKRVYIAILIFFALLCLMQIMHHPLGVSISEGKSFVFPEIIRWKQSGEIQTFWESRSGPRPCGVHESSFSSMRGLFPVFGEMFGGIQYLW